RMEPRQVEAFPRDEDEEGTLGRRVPQAGEIDDVPAIAEEDGVDSFFAQARLQTLDRAFVPEIVQPVEDGRLRVVGIALEQGRQFTRGSGRRRSLRLGGRATAF